MENVVDRFKEMFVFISKNKVIFTIVGFFVILAIVFFPDSLAQSLPKKSIEVFSENSNYNSKEAGAWKVTNSAEWIDSNKVRVSIDINSILRNNASATDVMFVLDNSMSSEKLNTVKKDLSLLLDDFFSNSENRAGLISFNSNAILQSDLTNSKDSFLGKINLLTNTGDNNTSYYKALVQIDKFMESYDKSDSRNLKVVFIVGGAPNVDIANSEAYYSYLLNKYSSLEINGVQYEMGNDFFSSLREITTNHFVTNKNNFLEVLFDILIDSKNYDEFVVEEKIDSEKFLVGDNFKIESSIGKASYNSDIQSIIWKVDNLKSGSSAHLKVDFEINESSFDNGALVPINKNITISSFLDEQSENVSSSMTPLIKRSYLVTYDKNLPSGCNNNTSIANENHNIFDSVSISNTKLKCNGYKFKGWEIVTKNVEMLNDNYFEMPEEDVTIRGIWSKLTVKKSMDGTIHVAQTLSRKMTEDAVYDDVASQYVSASTGINWNHSSSDTNGKGIYIRASTKNDAYPVYYYRGNITNNNVEFAGFCWKIVRTTATGGVKIIYNGFPDTNGKCTTQSGTGTQIGTSKFNSKFNAMKYLGYMYGNNIGENLYNSDIKTYIDTWYANNMTGYTSFLEDTPWCNDRTYNIDGNHYYFGEWNNRYKAPTFICPNVADKFTVSSENGNGLLTYPVALLTASESRLAGNAISGDQTYLCTGQNQWLLSPLEYTSYNYTDNFYLSGSFKSTTGASLYEQLAVRPVVSLRKDVEYSQGNGTPNDPYVIDMNS